MTWPTPTRQDHEKFCRVEEWVVVRDARGRSGTHHVTYELYLKDGQVLRTRISHPVNRTAYGLSMTCPTRRRRRSPPTSFTSY